MIKLNFDNPLRVHFIGIGGISMSGLAKILLNYGFTVTGSDIKNSELTKELEEKGAKIFFGQKAENITKNIDLVVYTAAIKEDNEELQEARKNNITVISRATLLGRFMDNYKEAVAICGTHGKTTTTSMIAECVVDAKKNPTVSVGGMLPSIGGNLRIGKKDIFVTEACEYMNSFLEFKPSIGLILNIEEDHLDFFKDIYDIRNSFSKFVDNIRKNGTIIVNGDILDYNKLIKNDNINIVTFGKSDEFDYYADDIYLDKRAYPTYKLYKNKVFLGEISLNVAGLHNVYNSLAAIATCMTLKIDFDNIKKSISKFNGAGRRFEYLGEFNQVKIIDDYAHHPTEIKASLYTANKCEHNELWVIFQPHTFSRTKALFNDFVEALKNADHVILADIYAAREKNTIGITSVALCDALKSKNVDAYYFSSFEEIKNFAQKKCKKNDLLITMGAGNVTDIAKMLLNE